jgi:hypothetical protein
MTKGSDFYKRMQAAKAAKAAESEDTGAERPSFDASEAEMAKGKAQAPFLQRNKAAAAQTGSKTERRIRGEQPEAPSDFTTGDFAEGEGFACGATAQEKRDGYKKLDTFSWPSLPPEMKESV